MGFPGIAPIRMLNAFARAHRLPAAGYRHCRAARRSCGSPATARKHRALVESEPYEELVLGALGIIRPGHGRPRPRGPPSRDPVAVTTIVGHPALDSVRDGVRAALKETGSYESGRNLKWQYQERQGNTGTARQIARKFVGDKPDTITSPSPRPRHRPWWPPQDRAVVFSAVTKPPWPPSSCQQGAQQTNVTGVSDLLALDKQMDLVKQVVPNAKRVSAGHHNPGEANSVVVVKSSASCPSSA